MSRINFFGGKKNDFRAMLTARDLFEILLAKSITSRNGHLLNKMVTLSFHLNVKAKAIHLSSPRPKCREKTSGKEVTTDKSRLTPPILL